MVLVSVAVDRARATTAVSRRTRHGAACSVARVLFEPSRASSSAADRRPSE